jgi:hypothetical protein
MPPVGFEPIISADERPKIYALDRAATGSGTYNKIHIFIITFLLNEKKNQQPLLQTKSFLNQF